MEFWPQKQRKEGTKRLLHAVRYAELRWSCGQREREESSSCDARCGTERRFTWAWRVERRFAEMC
eukprot:3604410-Rhodomonas_salina.3